MKLSRLIRFYKKDKKKEKSGDITIIKTPEQIKQEEISQRKAGTCPLCGQYHALNGGTTNGTYNFYRCRNEECKTEWKIKL